MEMRGFGSGSLNITSVFNCGIKRTVELVGVSVTSEPAEGTGRGDGSDAGTTFIMGTLSGFTDSLLSFSFAGAS